MERIESATTTAEATTTTEEKCGETQRGPQASPFVHGPSREPIVGEFYDGF